MGKCLSHPWYLYLLASAKVIRSFNTAVEEIFWDFWFPFFLVVVFVGKKRTNSILNFTFQSFHPLHSPPPDFIFSLSFMGSPQALATVRTFLLQPNWDFAIPPFQVYFPMHVVGIIFSRNIEQGIFFLPHKLCCLAIPFKQ